ncbi:MAG: 30S ribosomal protein S27ae [Nanoarchaeota archaeon]|nr:30S ribosomal protein S27ae [Nanoarchaeota archaeon]MBU1854772.1 30S ribosomal protein S27ae [Nanoarchaeota archaeon]
MADKKKSEKKKAPRQLWTLYSVEGNKLVRKNKFSPKSDGDFLAEHSDRRTCGKTTYMEKK